MSEPLLDPDCRDGKHSSCVGGPCECSCHQPVTIVAPGAFDTPADVPVTDSAGAVIGTARVTSDSRGLSVKMTLPSGEAAEPSIEPYTPEGQQTAHDLMVIQDAMSLVTQAAETISGALLRIEAAGQQMPNVHIVAEQLAGIALGWAASLVARADDIPDGCEHLNHAVECTSACPCWGRPTGKLVSFGG